MKKKVTKKKVSKASIKKKLTKKIPENHCFVLVTGNKINNVKELAEVLEKIDNEQYYHHVNSEKNDFANWIQDIFEEHSLADEIKKAKNKEHMSYIIYKHISNHFW